MIQRILIANRGEIAVRIIRACRELGIESVAVYSEADAHAPHVLYADRAVGIGRAAAGESYLSIRTLIDVAHESGADAVHPGYGFLSENARFAEACEEAGVIFIGPPAHVIERMGSKIAARQLMQAAGLPVVPGETPADQSDLAIAQAARALGLPVVVKASAGGGGKGMRTVREDRELDEAIRAARREAVSAFGDGTLYVERFIDRPRHIEVQIFADGAGQVVHLFERECSIQRRHQKIIEESPSTALTPTVRATITQAAVKAAVAVGYRNAGTVEFLFEGGGDQARFYFLEMNTRLQVEHPVTEAVTGVDLVRAQIMVAAGARLPWSQKGLHASGHAIECRVYAEDPSQGFLPQAGRLLLYRPPAMPGVRVDSGVVEGGDVSVYYDPMLAKVVAYGETRGAALARAIAALRAFPILGVRTNISFLIRILESRRFRSGDVDTGFVETAVDALAEWPAAPSPALAAAAFHEEHRSIRPAGAAAGGSSEAPDPWTALKGWRS